MQANAVKLIIAVNSYYQYQIKEVFKKFFLLI